MTLWPGIISARFPGIEGASDKQPADPRTSPASLLFL